MTRDYSICKGTLFELCSAISDWRAGKGFESNWANVPLKLMLVVTELGEAMEAYRKIPIAQIGQPNGSRPSCEEDNQFLVNFREELADAMIRLMDLSSSLGIDIEKEIIFKMEVNEGRPHKHGKQC